MCQSGILWDEKCGFQKKTSSCETQLLLAVHYLAKNMNDGLQTDVMFLE